MKVKLLNLPTNELLEKIGAGNHKPGSGSVAALNSIVSCKLILTVIQLTLGKTKYEEYRQECKTIQSDITDNIVPELEFLFQEDSEQFDRTIFKRRERNAEENQKIKNQLAEKALKELVQSTELPIKIANLSLKLADYSLFLFDNCFKSARGDSGVALNNALASITGCISIISLNLQSFPRNEWTEKIKRQRNLIRAKFLKLTEENFKRMDILDKEAERRNALYSAVLSIKNRLKGREKILFKELENLAKDIQNTLWIYKDLIWQTNEPTNPIGVLKPKKVIQLLKYDYKEKDSLGVTELNEEIAGIINNETDTIYLSKEYPKEVKNFTAAHEMSHALLHDDLVLHRDKPLDRPDNSKTRSIKELQADKLAAYFLMPEKRIRYIFKQLFQLDKFEINEQTAFALSNCSVTKLRSRVKNKRDLSRLIVKTNFFNFRPFSPMHSIFNVSVEAMSIRLEELDLISY